VGRIGMRRGRYTAGAFIGSSHLPIPEHPMINKKGATGSLQTLVASATVRGDGRQVSKSVPLPHCRPPHSHRPVINRSG
jgi:hypothetical protein